MNTQLFKGAVLAAAMSCSTVSFAGLITDVEAVNENVSWFEKVSWTHDLNDNGFALGSATSATLSIQFKDDRSDAWELPGEWATIIIGVVDFQDGAWVYNSVSDFNGSLGVNSLAGLNTSGLLDVTVWSDWGDFKIGNSTLKVTTADATVPEPGTLALLGLGLVGIGAAKRRKA